MSKEVTIELSSRTAMVMIGALPTLREAAAGTDAFLTGQVHLVAAAQLAITGVSASNKLRFGQFPDIDELVARFREAAVEVLELGRQNVDQNGDQLREELNKVGIDTTEMGAQADGVK